MKLEVGHLNQYFQARIGLPVPQVVAGTLIKPDQRHLEPQPSSR